jgi:DNA polymerase-3 subunit delta
MIFFNIMPEINFKELNHYLSGMGEPPPAWLIYGDEALYKTAFKNVMNRLLPESERAMGYEPVENDDVYAAIEKVNTFSLMGGAKVIGLNDSRVFYAKSGEEQILQKVKEAYGDGDMKKAAKHMLSLLGVQSLTLDDVKHSEIRAKNLKTDPDLTGEGGWLDEVIAFCMDNSLSPLPVQDTSGDLQNAVESGFPSGNYLIITADLVDKRRGLYKVIKEKGMVVNCAVPQGARKEDKAERDAILGERAQAILSKNGKTILPAAYHALCEMTGFDLRTFTANLEKLTAYSGNRREIVPDDVMAVVKRTKQDPIYELTTAVAERNFETAMFYLDSLLAEGLFPLQILAAIINQIRRLLVVRGFMESIQGNVWKRGTSYPVFQKSVMPVILHYDQALLDQISGWDAVLSSEKGGKKSPKTKPATDLVIAANAKSPYPVFLLFQRAENFSFRELIELMEHLSSADMHLKSTGHKPRLILEEAVLRAAVPRFSS